ncbi:phage tail protein [Streptomyces lichenis]|uniref:Phage tail protein n=1 Tax=Streptomyces lichenis TaxID=2306967 RepID=A0ABT0IE08_9ACTN|nr:phage tail protein [Streptomyces lichenis]MCK8679559.1 phage tail protein [Streptomyces lichenis]
MSRYATSSRRRTAGVAAAALLLLGLLTACGSGSSDTGAPHPSASPKAGSPTGPPDAGAKGSSTLSQPDGGELKFQEGEELAPRQLRLSVDGGTDTLTEVSAITLDQPTQQNPADGLRLIPGEQPQAGTVTVTRGSDQSQQFTDLIDGKTQPGSASLEQLDFAGNVTKRFTLQEPRVVKVENGSTQIVTIHFTSLTIS